MNEKLYSWTFNFHKVVRQQNSGAVEDFILAYSAVYLRIQKVKELLKSVHICQSYSKNKSGPVFFDSQCTYIGQQRHLHVLWLAVTTFCIAVYIVHTILSYIFRRRHRDDNAHRSHDSLATLALHVHKVSVLDATDCWCKRLVKMLFLLLSRC